jgi:hypothetical protein
MLFMAAIFSVSLLAVMDKVLDLEFWVADVSKTPVTDEHV